MFNQIRLRLNRWRLHRETSRRLAELDDHLLGDLGIVRDDIRCHAQDAVERQLRG